MNAPHRIRAPIVDGIFYPSDGAELKNSVQALIESASVPRSDAIAIISPHAGYTFCGDCIGASFAAARDRAVRTVMLIAPVHREPTDSIFLTESEQFMTPSGAVAVDVELTHELESCSTRILRNDIPHLEEHAIEVQLPFVRHLFPDATIIPILLGRASMANTTILATAIATVFDRSFESVLFVISSNLCSRCERTEAEMNMELLNHLLSTKDPEKLLDYYNRGELAVCGAGGLAALLMLDLPAFDVVVHKRCQSPGELKRSIELATYYSAISLHKQETAS